MVSISTIMRRFAVVGVAAVLSGCVAQQAPVTYSDAVAAPAPSTVAVSRYYSPGYAYGPGYAYNPYPFYTAGSLNFAYFGSRSYKRDDHDDRKGHRNDRRRSDAKSKKRSRNLSDEERAARRERRAERRNLSDEERTARRERRAERRAARGERSGCGRRGKNCDD